MKKTRKTASGTSFFNHTIRASVSDLKQILGSPDYDDNDGEDKVNFEWVMETESRQVFTVYDWKEYRSLKGTDIVEWHIGGNDASVTSEAKTEIESALSLKNTKNTSKVFAESGDMFITAVKKVKDMMKPSEEYLDLVFNDIVVRVYHHSHPADLATIYDLKHELNRINQH